MLFLPLSIALSSSGLRERAELREPAGPARRAPAPQRGEVPPTAPSSNLGCASANPAAAGWGKVLAIDVWDSCLRLSSQRLNSAFFTAQHAPMCLKHSQKSRHLFLRPKSYLAQPRPRLDVRSVRGSISICISRFRPCDYFRFSAPSLFHRFSASIPQKLTTDA